MDLQQAFDEGFDALKGYVDRSFEVFAKRFEAMEQRLSALPAPKDGKDADPEVVAEMVASIIEGNIRKDFDAIRADVDAINPKIETIGGAIGEEIAEHVGKALAAIPPAVTADDVKQMVTDAVAALPPAEKGRDADPIEVAAQIAQEVERAVAALPVPKDGQSVTLDDVRPLIDEAVTKAVTLIPVPKDGVDGKDGRNGLDAVKFFRDANGHLIVVKSDGSTDDLGEYVGKDGSPGESGKDGRDGFGFDDLEFEHDGERGFKLKFIKGDAIKEFSFSVPMVLDRGVFKEGTEYAKGDGVTWGRHYWIAKEATTDKPEPGSLWRLAVKSGRDGKDGIMREPPKPGPVKVG